MEMQRMRSRPALPALVGALLAAAIAACSSGGDRDEGVRAPEGGRRKLPPTSPPIANVDNAYALANATKLPVEQPIDTGDIHNLFKLSEDVISGSEPHGEAAFQKLQAMGVKTIVSVDGQVPDVELAQKYGLRYVHVPTEYRGLTNDEVAQLTKTYRECEAPFYTHCFHGKHRGPAAAEIGRIVLDGISREQAIAEMRQYCGTAPEYEGLYRDVATKAIPTEAESRAYEFDFPAKRAFTGFRDSMISISRREDFLTRASKKGFALDPEHPDVDPIHEAGTLADTLRITGELPEVKKRPADFQTWIKTAAEQALVLEKRLSEARTGDAAAADAAKRAYADLTATCKTCHDSYRNK
jgi:protein tyrosine phosphatase (PTP) superfamily phosphohydrolase (DUF442 family)